MARVRNQFLFAALLLTLWGTGGVGQILPYWQPEQYNETRKANDNFVIEPITQMPNRHAYLRGRPLEPVVEWSSHEGDTKLNNKQREGVKMAKKNRYHSSGKDPRTGLSQMKMRQKTNEDDAKSTRIAPLHLMQVVQESPKPQGSLEQKDFEKKKIDSYSAYLSILNAYSVEKQFRQFLSEFKDIEFSTEVLGRTTSYLDIVLFKISQKGSKYFRARETKYVENEPKEKKILFIVHALSPMGLANLYSLTLETHLKMLMSYYFAHLDKFDIYLMPMANPDGYEMARKNKYWNKNMASNAECSGVDVDRNFDVAWNNTEEQSSCAIHYPGPAPFSEPESRAVRDIFHRMSHKIAAYFHVHGGTYTMNTFKGDAVLYPKGYSDSQSDDDKYIDIKGEIDEAIKNANFKVLSVSMDTLYNWYGKVSGTSVDYAATVYGIPYAMELVMQLYQDAFQTHFDKVFGNDRTMMELLSLSEIWKRVIDVIFTNIHKKLEPSEATRI